MRTWTAGGGQLPEVLHGHTNDVVSLAFPADGRLLASASSDATVRLWVPKTGQSLRTLEGHTSGVQSVSFSADGRLLASKSGDRTVRLWCTNTWETVAILAEPVVSYWARSLAFHPSASVLATLGESDTVIRIWDLDLDLLLGTPARQPAVHYTTAKIVLVGESGVGKTGLGWRLAHGEFKDHPSTHGQQFWVVDKLSEKRTDGTECEAILWDLAGQPDYRQVHTLFLDDADVALVLFDPTDRHEPLEGVEYWLKQLRCGEGGSCRAILVGARLDRGSPTLTEGELQSFCQRRGLAGCVATSALSGEGVGELLEMLRRAVAWGDKSATVTTTTFKRIKDHVLSLKESGAHDGVLTTREALRALLEELDPEWRFSDDELMTAVKHLANHGYVRVLRGTRGEETILLAPGLLGRLASSVVLQARGNPKGLGAVEEEKLLRGEYPLAELEPAVGLVPAEREVLLDAVAALFLERHQCLREVFGERTLLVFPDLINLKKPADDVVTVDDVSYRISGAVEHAYSALVVLLGYAGAVTRVNQWQRQARYTVDGGEICGFRVTDEQEGELEVVLYYGEGVSEPTCLMFQGLFERFLARRDVTVVRYPAAATCPNCREPLDRSVVVRRIDKGKGFVCCEECGKQTPLPKAGEPVTLSREDQARVDEADRRARRRTAYETSVVHLKRHVSTVRGDAPAPTCFLSYACGDRAHERWLAQLDKDLRNAGLSVILDQRESALFKGTVARFAERIADADRVLVCGTPRYLEKYQNKDPETGYVVAAEVDLIAQRLLGTQAEKDTVVPLLVTGDKEQSFPPLLRGYVHADFRRDERYFAVLFDLILTLFDIPVDTPEVADLREDLRRDAEDEWR